MGVRVLGAGPSRVTEREDSGQGLVQLTGTNLEPRRARVGHVLGPSAGVGVGLELHDHGRLFESGSVLDA